MCSDAMSFAPPIDRGIDSESRRARVIERPTETERGGRGREGGRE
eukprot:COSAG03_NODE_12461_length_546_cov_1.682327_1_plen_44_part_10